MLGMLTTSQIPTHHQHSILYPRGLRSPLRRHLRLSAPSPGKLDLRLAGGGAALQRRPQPGEDQADARGDERCRGRRPFEEAALKRHDAPPKGIITPTNAEQGRCFCATLRKDTGLKEILDISAHITIEIRETHTWDTGEGELVVLDRAHSGSLGGALW